MKVGDKVRLVKDLYSFKKGTVYTVDYFIETQIYVSEMKGFWFRPDEVELVSENAGLDISQMLKNQTQTPLQSARYNNGKTQVRELDPAFIMGLGEVLTASRERYEEGNWMKETKFSTPYESCMRHLMKFWSGDDLDEDTKKSHLLHAATNLMFLHYHLTSGCGIDDRLFKKKKENG